MPKPDPASVYFFEGWEVDFATTELRSQKIAVPIGGRSFEILKVLVGSAGQVVTKSELMERVWPGVFVEDNTLQVHISAVRRALGADRGLLKTISGMGYRLSGVWDVRRGEVQLSDRDSASVPQTVSTNLPLGRVDLVGRSTALSELLDLVTAYRTITLTGPGGIGKTVLALEAGRLHLTMFSGEVRLIELVSLRDSRLVANATAAALDLRLGAEAVTPVAVARGIGGRRILLLFDNCEHVVDAVAELVETIVRTCPHATILATSRELLRIEGEYAYRVPPLDFPPEDANDASELLQHSAVQLFVARTHFLRSDYILQDSDIRAIAAICRNLDGIPLAIELAAARASVLGIDLVLTGVSDVLDTLTGGRRTALPRHQTLRAALDWSYDLLPENEKRLLRWLAVFSGGFTLEAVSEVLEQPSDQFSTAEGIGHLVEKSLVSLDQLGKDGRWRLLETTRSYALEKLRAQGEQDRANRRHAMYFRNLISRKTEPSGQGTVFARFGSELGNVRAALDWCFSPTGDAETGAVLTAAYAPVWFYLSSMPECRQQVERALSKLDDATESSARLRMQLYIALGLVLAYTEAMEKQTEEILAKALEIAERSNDIGNQLLTIWSLWNLKGKNGNHRESLRLAEVFRDVASRSGDPADVLIGERLLGTALHFRGRQADARRHLETVLEDYVAPTSERHSNFYLYDLRMVTLALLARVLVLQGLVQQAEASAQRSLAISKQLNSNLSTCYALRYAVCSVALITSQLDQAGDAIAELIHFAETHNLRPFLKQGRYLEGMLLIKRGEFGTGTENLNRNLDENIKNGWSLCYPEALSVLAEGYIGLGNDREASRVLQRAFDWSDQQGERWCDAELYRVQGTLLDRRSSSHERNGAESSLLRAIAIAQHHGALYWELKASLTLAQIWSRTARVSEAASLLRPVYGRFTEGFGTADLLSAERLLASTLA